MSHPSQFGPPNQPSGGGGSVLLWVLLIVGLIILLVCGGLCGGCLMLGRQVQQAVEREIQQGPLRNAYDQTEMAVLNDPQVQDRLGEPLEAGMYSRSVEGPLQPVGETIQFDVTGPKGKGIVSAVVVSDGANVWRPSKITVTFEDGSVVDVPPATNDFEMPEEFDMPEESVDPETLREGVETSPDFSDPSAETPRSN